MTDYRDEQYLSFDVESDPTVSAVTFNIEQKWNQVILLRRRLIDAQDARPGRGKAPGSKTRVVDGSTKTSPDLRRIPAFAVSAVYRKQKNKMIELRNADLQNLNATLNIYIVSQWFPGETLRLYVQPIPGSRPPRVRIAKVSRFEFAFVVQKSPVEVPFNGNMRELRMYTTKLFWRCFTDIYGMDAKRPWMPNRKALHNLWERSLPHGYNFGFFIDVSEADALQYQGEGNLCNTVKSRISQVAELVPTDARPYGWSKDPLASPFIVKRLVHSDEDGDQLDVGDRDFVFHSTGMHRMSFAAAHVIDFKLSLHRASTVEEYRSMQQKGQVPMLGARGGGGGIGGSGGFAGVVAPGALGSTRHREAVALDVEAANEHNPSDFVSGVNDHAAAMVGTDMDQSEWGTLVINHFEHTRRFQIMNVQMGTIWQIQETLHTVEKMVNAAESRKKENPETFRLARMLLSLLLQLQRKKLQLQLEQVGLIVQEQRTLEDNELHFLVTGPNCVLEDQAVQNQWSKLVAPDVFSESFSGGFLPKQFIRGGPMQKFWRETKENPYAYHPYFAVPNALDPLCPFSQAERMQLVLDKIGLARADVDEQGKIAPERGGAGLDVRELKLEGVVNDFVLLHTEKETEELTKKWAKPWQSSACGFFFGGGVIQQPLHLIRDYFGERISWYYAWVNHYTRGLLFPVLMGIVVFILEGQYFTIVDESIASISRIKPAFAVFMTVWSTVYLENWKRTEARLSYLWNTDGLTHEAVDTANEIRPAFITQIKRAYAKPMQRVALLRSALGLTPKDIHHNPSTREGFNKESLRADIRQYNELAYYPNWKRGLKHAVSYPFITITTIGLLVGLGFFYAWAESNATQSSSSLWNIQEMPTNEIINLMIVSAGQGLAIPLLNWVYEKLAVILTTWEFHRTDAEFESSLTLKLFVFRFVNSYAALFYIAFWVRDMGRLATQLVFILIIGGIVDDFQELIVPWFEKKFRGRSTKFPNASGLLSSVLSDRSRSEYDELEMSKDYMEMVIQFGYVTMFAVAFPLAPLVAFLFNLIELRIDAGKLTLLHRRPRPIRSPGIGTWLSLMELMSYIAAVTNILLIGVTTPGGFYAVLQCEEALNAFPCRDQDDFWVMIALEHVVVATKLAIDALISDIPGALDEDKFREQYFHLKEDERNRAKQKYLWEAEDWAAQNEDALAHDSDDDDDDVNFLQSIMSAIPALVHRTISNSVGGNINSNNIIIN